MKESQKDKEIIKSYCYWCNHDTNHEILFREEVTTDNNGDFWESAKYSVVKCCGCDALSFHREVESEDNYFEDEYGACIYVPEVTVFPHNKGTLKPLFDWSIPHEIRSIYGEAVEALNHNLNRLAGAGFRAVIEAICNHHKIEGKNLEIKINKMTSQGLITKKDRDRMHAIRFIGNDSIHEMKMARREELMIVLSIVNGMITNLYILDSQFRNLSDKPVQNYEEFELLLLECLKERKSGEVDTLRNIMKKKLKLIVTDDRSAYEDQLCKRIAAGEFTSLELCPPPPKGPKQYKKI